MRRPAVLLVAGLASLALAAGWLRRQPAAGDAMNRLRTASSPSARLYDVLAGALLGGLYDHIAAEAAVLAAAARPATPGEAASAQVLEIGPGPGHALARLARLSPRVDITGLDIDPAMIALARARIEAAGLVGRVNLVQGDVGAMPFADESFDLVVSSFSAHHWPDGPRAFGEIRRVLRPGGRAVIYDLPDGWGRFETGASGLAAAASDGGFEDALVEPVTWPSGVRLVRRLLVRRTA